MSITKKTMLDYVSESPEAMRQNIKNSVRLTAPLTEEYIAGGCKNLWIVASGSSSNGAACARQFIRRYLGCDVKIVTPFTFEHAEHDFTEEDLVICISQSGYSTNTIQALKLLKKHGKKAIGLTGDLSSDLTEYTDILIDYGVGTETVGYVTKGVTTLALFLMLFALETALRLNRITVQEYQQSKEHMLTAADCNQTMQNEFRSFYKTHYKNLSSMKNAYICSSGANIGTAMEGALKIGETVRIPTACYEVEEYIHGPNLQLTPNYTVFIIDGGCGCKRTKEIYDATRLVTDRCYLITNQADHQGNGALYIPANIPKELTPLCYLPFFQMLSCMVTDDLNLWEKHPLQKQMEMAVASKSENYVNSPLKIDDPGI